MLLSIIIPCFNVSQKVIPLLDTLSLIKSCDIEFIFVDDGSDHEEHLALSELLYKKLGNVQLYIQINKGPGAARNLGTRKSRGEYVWFVDADDNLNPSAIDTLREAKCHNFDFIDFKISKREISSSSMTLGQGAHIASDENRSQLIYCFGRLCTKIFNKSFITKNGLFYPERCIYEDNFLAMAMPFYVSEFLISGTIGYYHNISRNSITRPASSIIEPRYFDRLVTARESAARCLSLCKNEDERHATLEKFRRQFLMVTTAKIIKSGSSEMLLSSLYSAYKFVIEEFLKSKDVHDEFIDARKLLIHASGADKQRVMQAWDSSLPDEKAMTDFVQGRDEAWGGEVDFPVFM
ncbi:glycosyltransferase family 2 protein [Halomonas sp. 5021]|uniref:glycosyltransferase family 2 protein n=1 Tax=Halomonas sp. 5021 TaxID=3082156 RepID=UPI002FC9F6A7